MPQRLFIISTRLVITALVLALGGAASASTATFDPNSIISDNDLENPNTVTVGKIQTFLEGKRSYLAQYKTKDITGQQKTAAQIIFDAGLYWKINPQYLLVRMQIEQSLITDATPSDRQLDWATGYAVCDSCSTSDPALAKYKGFFNQANWAARKVRESYLTDLATRGTTISGWGVGITKTTGDGYQVTPINKATAALYTYTPYVYNANYNIWSFWNSWFVKKYPDGTLLQIQGQPGVFLIQGGLKRPFFTRTALVSRFDPTKIIQVSKSDLDLYDKGAPLRFANFSLIRSQDTRRIYLVDGDTIRYITSPEVFRNIGFNPEEVIDVPQSDLNSYQTGADINEQSIYPTGVLLQSKQNGGISYVQDGVRHSLLSREIFKSRFSNRKPVIVDQATVDQYPKADPITFKDGDLVTSPNANGVYVISNGQRRGIASKQIFDALGYQWKNVIKTSDAALFIHPEGSKVDFGS